MKKYAWLLLSSTLLLVCSCTDNKPGRPPINDSIPRDTSLVSSPDVISNPYSTVDVSPMDMSYFPNDYPKLKMSHTTDTPPLARVVYSRPHLQGRRLFDKVLKYDEPWRLGANESTELQLFKNAMIQGKKIPAGRYVLYCIPHREHWTIVLNSNLDSWGLSQDSVKDVARVDVPVRKNTVRLEYFTMVFEKSDKGTELVMVWDDTEARLPIEF